MNNKSTKLKLVIGLLPLVVLFCSASSLLSKVTLTLDLNRVSNKQLFIPSLTVGQVQSAGMSEDFAKRRDRCITAGRWVGALAGSTIGVMHITFAATGVSGVHGSFGQNLLIAIPSIVIGSYVGVKMNEWATIRIMNGNPGPIKAIFKGMAYGALAGAVIFTSSVVPLLTAGYFTGSIHFNDLGQHPLFQVIGIGLSGGIGYGGFFGLELGALYGPCISLYMRF